MRALTRAEPRSRRRRQRSALANELRPDPAPLLWSPYTFLDGPVALPIWFSQRWIGGPCGRYRLPSESEREALGDSAAFY